MLYTDFVPDVEMKYLIGYFCIAFVGLNLIVNIGIISFYTIKDCRDKFKQFRQKKNAIKTSTGQFDCEQ